MKEEAIEAIKKAKDTAKELYEEDELEGLRLEEIESSHDNSKWLITLGWNEQQSRREAGGIMSDMQGTQYKKLPRVYKVFHVNKDNLEIDKVEMRNE